MQVITTHFSADFDCMSTMVAAHKLYPEAKMVFSGSMEKPLQEYLKAVNPPFHFSRIKDVDLDKVTRLIVVDTQDPERIGIFKTLLDKKEVEVHVYDHHMDVVNPLKADQSVIRKRGSCATIMCEELAERGIDLSPEECTLMTLGIYQDTHSLISVSTTPEDFQAAGRMVAMGADLNTVAEFVEARLNDDQLKVMNDLIRNLEIQNFNGVDVALCTASLDYYVGDLAVVVYRLMQLENLSAAFALILLESRVYMIGRSRTEEINASHILREFGGGGHANAAAASTHDITLIQAREKLVSVLNDKVEPVNRIREVMHYPVISVKGGDTLEQTEKMMTRSNLNTLPVLSGKKLVGIITRQTVEKALHHKMGRHKTEEVMAPEFTVTTPDAYFKTIVSTIVEDKQKVVPVVDPQTGHLVGIVSRGDLLRNLQQDLPQYSTEPYTSVLERGGVTIKHVKSLMAERLPKEIMSLLNTVAKVADRQGVSAYVVGGFVRDLLLRIDNYDMDIVIEDDGIHFAKVLGKELNAKVVSHPKFRTSVVCLPDGSKVDVATARTEYYKHPAALPTVEMSSIKSDLFRRDFTFNSLALKLNGKNAFSLLDHFNGQRDLKDKVVRVLHNLSFIEDPSRAFRAIRFEQRLEFRIGKQTESFIKHAVKKKFIEKMSGARLYNELVLILKEPNPLSCLRRMKELDLLQFIHPKVLKNKKDVEVIERVQEVFTLSRIVHLVQECDEGYVYLLAMLYPLDGREIARAGTRLHLSQKQRRKIKVDFDHCKSRLKTFKKKTKLEPSEIYNLLSDLSSEALLLLMAVSGSERINKYILLFFTEYHDSARLSLTGDDLIDMGIQPGPIFKTVFKTLRDARVNGLVHSREEEVTLVQNRFLDA
ncbi:MAG: CBS domain-containing protein [Nitrospinota bacterium]|nr:CBS domain-containing protein [Nitrospinota bacterium]